MKFIITLIVFILSYTPILNAQEFKFDGNKMTVIFESSLNKKELHSKILAALENIYMFSSEYDEIQLNDIDNGKINVKSVMIHINELMKNRPENKCEKNPSLFERKSTTEKNYKQCLEINESFGKSFLEYNLKVYIRDLKYKIEILINKKYSLIFGSELLSNELDTLFDIPTAIDIYNERKTLKELAEIHHPDNKVLKVLKEGWTFTDEYLLFRHQHAEIMRNKFRELALSIEEYVGGTNQDDDW